MLPATPIDGAPPLGGHTNIAGSPMMMWQTDDCSEDKYRPWFLASERRASLAGVWVTSEMSALKVLSANVQPEVRALCVCGWQWSPVDARGLRPAFTEGKRRGMIVNVWQRGR